MPRAEGRQSVRKTYKLFIGGAFPRSESGHSYVVGDVRGRFVANAALASRKDARDAVTAARKAFPGWSGRTPYNRGQVLYRIAEVMEDRRPQFVEALRQGEGLTPAGAARTLDATIGRLVWYAGWAGKLAQGGYALQPDADGADVVVVNTCGFIEPGRQVQVVEIRGATALVAE